MPAEKKQGDNDQRIEGEQKQRVTPDFKPMPSDPPESGIGKRIAFARQQLGLSIEALARYTANFDDDKKGISPTSLLRYESSEYEPGAREIRILCDAFDASPRWLLYGALDNAGRDEAEQALLKIFNDYIDQRVHNPTIALFEPPQRMTRNVNAIDQRLSWLAKAKKPSPR